MNTINIAADATAQRIGIGNQYENEATAVVFDCSQFAEDHGAGTAQIIHRRPTESIGYVCTNVSQTNNSVTWLVTDDDTSFTGKGQVQLRWYVDEVLRESVIFPTYILPSVASSDDAPAEVKSALERLMEWVNDNTISIEDLDERIANYFDEHPIPTPVTSVNEKLGDVVLTAEDVGAYSAEEADEKFCVPDGEYEELNAGTAKQLLSDSYTLDQVPYLFRKSPDSDRAVEEIVGGTVGWNQLCNSASVTVMSGHKYYMVKGGVKSIGASTRTAITGLTSGTDIVTDLTTMFGSTIADYIYSLETATAGAGVAKLKEWGFFTEDYYEYCEPTLKSVEGLQSKVTRDADDNIIATYPLDSTLTLRGVPKLDSNNNLYFDGDIYPADGNGSRKYGLVDLGELNWSYESDVFRLNSNIGAKKETNMYAIANIICPKYPTVSQVTMGLQSTDKVIAGLNWSNGIRVCDSAYTDAATFKTAMSGVYLVYELATPTTFTALPYHNPQIVGDTEEWVTTGIVPVGHSTKYYQNLRKKIEGLPWNFSSLIAPTEVTNKATRNYTAGSYLILNNVLYKVTSNIANGGTITPNTNCTATTIMAEFMSL